MFDSRLTVRQIDGVAIAGFRDTSILDVTAIQQIGRALDSLAAEPDVNRVILDFDGVRFLSSQALGIILSLRKRTESLRRELVLCGVRPELMQIFRITNLHKILDIYDDLPAALSAIGLSLPSVPPGPS